MVLVSVKAILSDQQGRVLFVRNPRNEFELPGGRPETGESLEAALTREVREECGITVVRAAYAASESCEIVPGKNVLLVFYRCAYIETELVLSQEHTDYAWIPMQSERPAMMPEFYWRHCLSALGSEVALRD